MRKVGIRQFQQNFHKELKNTPFIVTKDGQDFKKVVGADVQTLTKTELKTLIKKMVPGVVKEMIGVDVPTTEPLSVINVDLDKINLPDASQITDPNFGMAKLRPLPEGGTMLAKSPTGKCETIQVNCRNIGKAYRVTIPADEGEKKNDMFLCDLHLKRAKDHGMEIEEL